MKFLLAIFALTSGLVGALEDCGGSPCTPDPDCPPTFAETPNCPNAVGCLITAAGGVTTCESATDYTCLCQCENREALFNASLVCLIDERMCTATVVSGDVFDALQQFCADVVACEDPPASKKSTKRLGGKGSSAKGLGGSSAKRLNGTSSSAAV